jgi:hypothetical protein
VGHRRGGFSFAQNLRVIILKKKQGVFKQAVQAIWIVSRKQKNHLYLYLLMAVDLVSKPKLHLLLYASTSELTIQQYSVTDQLDTV